MELGSLSNRYGIEVGALQKYRGSAFRHAGTLSAKNTCNTKSVFRITNHQILSAQFPFNVVERDKSCAFGHCFHNHLLACNLSGIKSMQGLPQLMQYVVRNIHHVVNRPHTNAQQTLSHPLWRLSNMNTL